MYRYILNVFIVLLSSSSFVYSQTPLQAAISQLNPCANNCIARAARFIKCSPTDFACLCAHPDAVIGPDRQFSPQGGCLFHDCGPPNVPDVKSKFKKLCALQAASSAVASILPASTQVTTPAPVAAPSSKLVSVPDDRPAARPPTLIPTTIRSFPSNSPPPATIVPLTTSVNDIPPPPAPSSTQVQLPASTAPVTQNLPTDSPAPLPITSISEATPPPAQVFQPVSNPTFLTPSPETTDLPSTPFSLSLDSTTVLASLTSSPTSLATSSTNSNSILQTSTSLPSTHSKQIPTGAVVGIVLLVLGFVATILSGVFIQLRRRKQDSYISDRRLEDKLHQQIAKDENSPSTQGGRVFPFSAPIGTVARWLPWNEKKTKNSTLSSTNSESPTSTSPTQPKTRGAPNERPASFPLLMQIRAPQGVQTSSPTSSTGSESGPGTSGSSISSSGQPLKSAMKKPRDRPKNRPLILKDGDGGFSFGLDPLGSNNKIS